MAEELLHISVSFLLNVMNGPAQRSDVNITLQEIAPYFPKYAIKKQPMISVMNFKSRKVFPVFCQQLFDTDFLRCNQNIISSNKSKWKSFFMKSIFFGNHRSSTFALQNSYWLNLNIYCIFTQNLVLLSATFETWPSSTSIFYFYNVASSIILVMIENVNNMDFM
eukprot:275373_1